MNTSRPQEKDGVEINAAFAAAFELIEKTPRHVFVTGRAGTGKSTFLQYLRGRTAKNMVVLAPTGVAAVNIKGQTIHSFFNFRPDVTIDGLGSIRVPKAMVEIYRHLDTIVVDEISMVRADLLDCMDAFLRRHGPRQDRPFGGVQMVFIGDLYQLAPVVTPQEQGIFQTLYPGPYFFDARVFPRMDMAFVEFEKNYRQKDGGFIELLNAVRNNTVEQRHIDALNERCRPEHEPQDEDFYVYLTTTNRLADRINTQRLHALEEELFVVDGRIGGEFDPKSLPTHQSLELKIGAQVILLNNDAARRWVNGSIGRIVDIFESEGGTAVQVELAGGERVEVEPFTWELFRFSYDEEEDRIVSDVVGTFRQLPLKLAWAITIHKSQGKTFEKVIIDLGRGAFCHGQLYVALSRCRTLEGIVLKRPVRRADIVMDRRVTDFLTEYQYAVAEKTWPLDRLRSRLEEAVARGETVEIVYLKEHDVKHLRRIVPREVRPIVHRGQKGWGVEAWCCQRRAPWIFRLNCILDIRPCPRPEAEEVPT